jgi:23S rRNA (uracil1939-C5)-methyltransferase
MWDKILDINKCHLQEDPSNAIRNEVRDFANANGLTFFNPRAHEGLLYLNAAYIFYRRNHGVDSVF